MASPDWKVVYDLAQRALDIHDRDAREAFLDRECGSDLDLRRRVVGAVAAAETDAGFDPPELLTTRLTGQVVGDYEVFDELGRGGIGVVYRARQRSSGLAVALKVLPLVLRANDVALERFRREAAALASLDHPGILRFVGKGEKDGTVFYAMELVEGPGLREVMARAFDGRPEPRDPDVRDPRVAARLVMQVADALDYAHEKLVHRDVKPSNIMIDANGRARLIDFGLALVFDTVGLTNTGEVLGTSEYMSPEQVRAARGGVDRRSDIFSLGVVLYELLTRAKPFRGDSPADIGNSILNVEPEPPRRVRRDVPVDLETICLHALEKDREHRFQSAREFAQDLDRYLRGEPIRTKRRPLRESVRRQLVRRRTVLTAVPIALAAGAGFVFALPKRRPTFRVDVQTTDGARVRLLSAEQGPGLEDFDGDVVDHGRGTSFSIDLPVGSHRLELVAHSGDFAQARAHRLDAGAKQTVVARLQPTVSPDEDVPGWSHVPALDLRIPLLRIAGREFRPAPSTAVVKTRPLLVDRAVLSNADHRAFLAAAPHARRPILWDGDSAPGFVDRTDSAWLELPVVFLSFDEGQGLATWMGGRLPTASEIFAAAVGTGAWWGSDGRRADELFVVGRSTPDVEPSSRGVGLPDMVVAAEGVRSRPPLGPHGLHHPLGNVAVWTETPGLSRSIHGEDVFDHSQFAVFGCAWDASVESIAFGPGLIAGSFTLGGHVQTGVRRVRLLAPQFGRPF
jgi:serine/threonine protein kinase